MKLLLDTTNKTIKIEESVTLGELTDTLEKMLPLGLWKEFTLETNTQIVWSNPIVIGNYPYIVPYPTYPWYNPPRVTYTNDGMLGQPQLQSGTYCIEV